MGKESKAGTQFYASTGLKSVTVHLPKQAHLKLAAIAKKQDRSLQKTIRRILVEYADKH
jgi:predicted HicB family RNase H-like nuclease